MPCGSECFQCLAESKVRCLRHRANAEGGDGGNITIGTDTLLGIDNSDITANAVEGDGGNITITADAIVGFAERAELTPLSDITASSDFGAAEAV